MPLLWMLLALLSLAWVAIVLCSVALMKAIVQSRAGPPEVLKLREVEGARPDFVSGQEDQNMPDRFVTVGFAAGRHIAEAIKVYLEDRGVDCLLSSEAGGAFGFSVGGLARVEILVPARQAEQARQIIERYYLKS